MVASQLIRRTPFSIPFEMLKRFTAVEYNRLVEGDAFEPDERLELLDGYLVRKMPHNEPHATAIAMLQDIFIVLLKEPWRFRVQLPVSLSGDSVPEPDLAVVLGPQRRFLKHHPRPADIGLLIEVSESTLDQDRGIKQRLYANEMIPEYWIVNLVERVVEVYSEPQSDNPAGYRRMTTYAAGSSVPLRLGDTEMGAVVVSELY
jgi:Uma2 family endonuclease